VTVPTNTLQVYTQTNIREDLSNEIYNVDPFKTPFFNMAKKGEAKQTYHEWDTDALAAQNLNNAAVEGDNPTNIQLTPTARMGNRTQISTKTIQISGTSQAVVAAGGSNKMGYQLMKKSKELKRDIEGILTANNAQAAGSSTVPRISAGLPAFLATNFLSISSTPGSATTGVTNAGTSSFGNGTAAYTAGSGFTNAVTEANVKTVLQDIYKQSGESPDYALVSPANKQTISTFTGPGTRFIEVDDATLKTKVDVYESDFGDVKLIPDIFLASSHSIFFINPNYVRCAYLRPFQTIPLAKTGDSDQKELLVEYTLEVGNEHAHGFLADTNG
jgi:Family of unknown function (DUF5309)